MLSEPTPVTCPSCFEEFEVSPPAPNETPCEWDYDCEICCHPMIIAFSSEDGEVFASARSLTD